MIIQDNKNLPKPALQVLAVVGWLIMAWMVWTIVNSSIMRSYFSIGALAGQIPELDPFNERYRQNPWLTMMHTAPGILFAILGPIQFMTPVRNRFRKAHRISGRVFLVIGMLSGISALLITFVFPMFGTGRNVPIASIWALWMLFSFVMAFRNVKNRNFLAHREWMIRGFIAGMAVSVFRILQGYVFAPLGYDFNASWDVVVWLAPAICIPAAEFWIWATKPKKRERQPVAAEATA